MTTTTTTTTMTSSNTAIDLTLGINMQIGSVPVSLAAEVASDAKQSVYTFSGSVQSAVIDIAAFMSYVGQQFGVDVQLPPELDLKAMIDYVAGQIIYTKPKLGASTTEMGVAAKFELIYSNGGPAKTFGFSFYADTILQSDSQTSIYVVGASLDTDLPFKELPLVGTIPVFNEYVLKHVGFTYTNADAAQNGGKAIQFNLPQVKASTNPLKTAGSPTTRESKSYAIDSSGEQTRFALQKKGFALTAGLMRTGSATAESNFSLPMALPPTAPPVTPASYYQGNGAVNASPPGSSINWINVNKTFGPVDLQKIGLNYKNGEATFGLTAGFSMGAFSLALQGLEITFPLPLPGMPAGDSVSFDLAGLAMAYQTGAFKIGGAFLKSDHNGITNYFGQVAVQVSSFGFTAIGGYAPAQNQHPASFFLYANLQVPLGGPPFLYVTGLAFGFGVNYALNLPTIETLPGYLLLPGNAPAQPAKAGDAFNDVLTKLSGGNNPVVTNQPGQYWAAAGIQFTSFNMISAFALVTVSFGVEQELGLLGAGTITLPKGASSPLAYVEVDLLASFKPSNGSLQIAGVISPASYLWGDFVKISGGFALGMWYGGTHGGDFVFSIGGYNNSFNKPAWYPAVPRLQLGFVCGPFHATGLAYLALTPAMFMAGMQFSATFSAGPIKAWFSTGFNFLISWAPFFYRANAYINVGCSVNLGLFTIRVSVGANLQVWGPEFGGRAEVDLDIISFTIKFGSSKPNPVPLSWNELEQNFLPGAAGSSAPASARSMKMLRMNQGAAAHFGRRKGRASLAANDVSSSEVSNSDVISASVALGLLQQDVVDANGRNWDWIVDPNNFQIVTATNIPVNQPMWANSSSTSLPIPNRLADYDLPNVLAQPIPYLTLSDPEVHYSATEVWNPSVSIKPMKLADVQSIYRVSVAKLDRSGQFSQFISELKIAPVLANSNTALWGAPGNLTPNTPSLLLNTLLGWNLFALPRNPNTVNNVPLIQLIFTAGNQTTFTGTAAQPDRRYRVASSITPPQYDLTINVSGASTQTFINQDYILSTLIAPWVTEQRAALLNDLNAAGFDTYTAQEINLKAMGSTESLVDWPMVAVLGEPLAA